MDIIDPALDFMEFIALLAGICGICFAVIIPLTKKLNEVTYQLNLDKTVGQLQGEKPMITEDGCFTAEEIANTVACQNPYLVNPVSVPKIENLYVYKYCDDEIDALTTSQKPVILEMCGERVTVTGLAQYDPDTSSIILKKIKTWCASKGFNYKDMRFKIMFSMGESSLVQDNVYQLYYLENGEFKKCI